MRRFLAISGLFLLSALLAPEGAWAAEEEGGWGWLLPIGRWFNLLLILVPTAYLLRKPLGKFFSKRRREIQREIEEAKQARAEAEEKLAEVQSRMKALDDELRGIREAAKEEAEAERGRLLDEARRDGERIVAAAEREIENLKRQAREDLKRYAAELSVEMAEKQIRESMTERDESRLVDRFFVRLGSERGG